MYNYRMEKNNGMFNKPLPLSAKGGGLSFSVAVVANIVVGLIASLIITAGKLQGTEAATYISYLTSSVALVATALVYRFAFKQSFKTLLPVKCKPKYYLIGLMLVFGLLFSLNSLNGYLVRLFELMGYTPKESNLPKLDGWYLLPAMIVIAVLPAVLEEGLFRGVILNNAEAEVGTVRIIFIVGFLFSLYHASVEQTIYQFICGCLFTLLAVRARSILPSMLIHFINNALILILYSFGCIDAAGSLIVSQIGNVIITVLSAVCLAGAVIWLVLDKKVKGDTVCGERKNVLPFFAYAAVGVVLTALSWVLNLL